MRLQVHDVIRTPVFGLGEVLRGAPHAQKWVVDLCGRRVDGDRMDVLQQRDVLRGHVEAGPARHMHIDAAIKQAGADVVHLSLETARTRPRHVVQDNADPHVVPQQSPR